MFFTFLYGIVLYVVAVTVAYNTQIKATDYYLPLGLALALATNWLWLMMIRNNPNQSDIMVKGFMWDGMRILIYTIVPILFLGVQFTWNKAFACALIGLGMVLLRIG